MVRHLWAFAAPYVIRLALSPFIALVFLKSMEIRS
jgi:hypothetical protein